MSGGISVEPEAAGLDPERLTGIDAVVGRYMQDGTIAGAVVLVSRRNRIGYRRAFGRRNESQPLEAGDIFQVTSVSKAVLGVAMMRLVDEGLVSPGDRIGLYIPEYADMTVAQEDAGGRIRVVPAECPLTLHHLLSMTSGGVNSYMAFGAQPAPARYVASELSKCGAEMAFSDRTVSIEESVRRMAGVPLANQPGAQFIYSEYNCLLLARVIELVSGMRYDEYLEHAVFGPLGMRDSTFHPDVPQLPRIAGLYRAHDTASGRKGSRVTDPIRTEDGRHVLFDPRHEQQSPGAGVQPGAGLYSTASDIHRIAVMLASGGVAPEGTPAAGSRFLSCEAVQLMTTNRIGDLINPITDNKWGYMVSVQWRAHPTTIYYGGEGGFGRRGASGPEFWVNRKYGTQVVVMTQAWWSFDIAGLKARIAQVVNRSLSASAED